MNTRRSFLQQAAAVTAAFPWVLRGAARRAGDKKRRRIIWNNDGDDLWGPAHGWQGFPSRLESVDQFLGLRMKPLEGTQVDSLFYCAFTTQPSWEFPTENIQALGPDPLKHAVDFAHKNGMEFVYSIRMNDIHDAFMPGTHWNFKADHPELLQANETREEFEKRFLPWIRQQTKEHPLQDVRKRRGLASRDFYSWSALDYAHPEVRARFLSVVEGACQRYDLEGIELDWGRHPFYFKFGEERRNIPVMTDFVRQVRQRLQHYGQKRGRPILLAMRVADSPALSLSLGLDVESWMGEGWVDLLIAGFGYTPFTIPLGDWVRLGHQHGIPVYGCLSRSTPLFEKPEAIRAAAYRYWEEGVDGIYFFNLFFDIPKDYACLHEVGDPTRLVRLNKLYQVDTNPIAGYMNLSCWPGPLPLAFTTQSGSSVAKLTLQVADRPETAKRVAAQTQWKQGANLKRVSFELNGQRLANPRTFTGKGKDQGTWTEYETRALRRGENSLQVKVQPPEAGDPTDPAVLEQVRVSIDYV